jgi:hypothetical protein
MLALALALVTAMVMAMAMAMAVALALARVMAISGVHVGQLASHKGQEVVLRNSRRIWRWRGANTLNELSVHGADEDYTRISEPVAQITLCEVCEVLPCTPLAARNLSRSRWAQD